MAEVKQRNQQYDILRIILTDLVVIGHGGYYSVMTKFGGIDVEGMMCQAGVSDTSFHGFVNLLCSWIYTFHMPAFLALSGCIFREQLIKRRYENLTKLIRRKWHRLILPLLFVWFFWNVPVKWISGYYAAERHPVVSAAVQIIFPDNVYLWYLEVLFLCFPMAWMLVRKMDSVIGQGMIVGSAWCLDRIVGHFVGGGYIPFVRPFRRFHWFWIGMWMPDLIRWLREHGLWKRNYIAILAAMHTVGWLLCERTDLGRRILSEFALPILGILCIWYVSEEIAKILTERKRDVLYVAADMSFGIYLWAEPLNYLILFFVSNYIGVEAFGQETTAALLFAARIIVTPAIAVIISRLLHKVNFPIKAY